MKQDHNELPKQSREFLRKNLFQGDPSVIDHGTVLTEIEDIASRTGVSAEEIKRRLLESLQEK
jgi:hypothetical protein